MSASREPFAEAGAALLEKGMRKSRPGYEEYVAQSGPIKVKVCAFPEHEHYARIMVGVVAEWQL